MRILFVCTGNTCRSPMAEKLLKKMAEDRGLDLEVKSAGLFASQGSAASPQAVHILEKRGITESHQSQPASRELLDWADLVLTMTESHRDSLLQKYEELQNKIYTLKEFADVSPEAMNDVADPYGGTVEDYERCAVEIEEALRDLLTLLEKNAKND